MKNRYRWKSFAVVQLVFVGALALAYTLADAHARNELEVGVLGKEFYQPVPIPRDKPLRIQPNYNRPDLVSDEDLAAVLDKIQPTFDRKEMKPNYVEHALRTWGVTATFQNPEAVSGQEMLGFLTDSAKFMESWGEEIRPILEENPHGVHVRWGTDKCASYHHDHLLACVSEAGAPLNTPVYGMSRTDNTLYDIIQESLRDFRLDERETEWTVMAFGLWIPPTREWIGAEGRHYSFDLLADRLMRGEKRYGVCSGTHRVYSLMLLIRLDDDYQILTPAKRDEVYGYLEDVRDLITVAQFEDGRWPANWPDGKDAVENPIDDPEYRQVIATGHHLEWMSIAPPDLLVPDAQIKKAVDWLVKTTREKSYGEIMPMYTFYSHVGAALANWRQVHPSDFWREWEKDHPFQPRPKSEKPVEAAAAH